MNKKLISFITALSMCATMAFVPITASADDALKNAILTEFEALDLADGTDDGKYELQGTTFERQVDHINVLQSNTINGITFDEILVDTNIQAKTATASSYADENVSQTVTDRATISDFSLKTTMYMSGVKSIYDKYIALATLFVNNASLSGVTQAELDGIKVKGEFTITVKLPTGLTIADEAMKQDNKNMYGLAFEDGTAIFTLYKEISRTYTSSASGEVLNITIAPSSNGDADYAHKSTLDTHVGKNIVIQCPVKAVAPQTGTSVTYTAEGYVNGWTEICSAANDSLAVVNYKANQSNTGEAVTTEGAAGNENIILSEDVVVNYTQPSSPTGGGGVSTYTLKFETNGGDKIAPISKTRGTSIDLTVYKPTKEGFVFEGWYSDSALTKPVDKVTLNSNMTVYAKWSDATGEDDVTLTFVSNGGSEISSLTTNKGTSVDINDYITLREGYTFEGWYLDEELTVAVDTHTLHNDTTVYAKWSETPIPSQLTDEHYAYIIGRTDGLVHPEANITRAEVATIFFRLLTPEVRDGNLTKENQFDDVNEDNWFCAAVSTLADLGIINGRTDTTFVPNAFITRAEYAAIASRFSDIVYNGKNKFSDIDNHWAQDEINEAAHIGWIIGDGGKFKPDVNITRAEAMTLTNRVLKRIPQATDDLLDDMIKWPDNMDTTMWYYLAVQEATNSHDYELKEDNVHEKWSAIEAPRDWTEYEK